MKLATLRNHSIMVALIMWLPTSVMPQYERPGSSGAQFLDIGVDARAEAMAGANISVVSGLAGVFYNPAAVSQLSRVEIMASYTPWFAGISHEFMAIGIPIWRSTAVAFSVTGLQTDEMKVRTPLQPDGTGETFYAGSVRVGVTFSRALTTNVNFGLTLNYIDLSLYRDFNQGAFAGDVGVIYKSGIRNFRFGFMMANVGSAIQFVNESYPMPTSFLFGASANILETDSNTLLLSLATKKPNDGAPQGIFGLEYSINRKIFIRGGYDLSDAVRTFALGGGVLVPFGNKTFRMDYSYNDFSDLGGVQRFTVGYRL